MPGGDHDQAMSVIKINAITVREGSGDELAQRFAHRAGAVDDVDGFEGFELLRPDDGRDTWLVVTRWRDDDAFDAWVCVPRLRPRPPRRATPGGSGDGSDGPAPADHSDHRSVGTASCGRIASSTCPPPR